MSSHNTTRHGTSYGSTNSSTSSTIIASAIAPARHLRWIQSNVPLTERSLSDGVRVVAILARAWQRNRKMERCCWNGIVIAPSPKPQSTVQNARSSTVIACRVNRVLCVILVSTMKMLYTELPNSFLVPVSRRMFSVLFVFGTRRSFFPFTNETRKTRSSCLLFSEEGRTFRNDDLFFGILCLRA